MRNRPNAADLLAIARETFLSALMPQVPDGDRYTALMVASAMANAERETAAGDEPLRVELERLRAIYPRAPASDDPVAVQLESARNVAIAQKLSQQFSKRCRKPFVTPVPRAATANCERGW